MTAATLVPYVLFLRPVHRAHPPGPATGGEDDDTRWDHAPGAPGSPAGGRGGGGTGCPAAS
ncbi:hypothetical protein ACFWNK_36235 [Streptomyces sp. NPDC058417]|uniref:hypothetical protein n=1 Tax=unclassified Streptomyces TaxID=2593676 RepID=UPI003654509F